MRKIFLLTLTLLIVILMNACQSVPTQQAQPLDWSSQFKNILPYLGHRNWIVITDMAYPLQSGNGITTLYADEDYLSVLKTVKLTIDKANHVFAHVYHDQELEHLTEEMVPGINEFRSAMNQICGSEAQSILHEDLLAKMDEAGKLYNILIIKTPLTMAYTSTFFELDCAYWNASKQHALDAAMGK